jgi:hypothetical protein
MADITKCKGTNCPIKQNCYRYTAKEDKLYQAYFVDPPFTMNDEKFDCEMYWGEIGKSIYKQLKDITKTK